MNGIPTKNGSQTSIRRRIVLGEVMKEVRITDLSFENLWDVASFCLRGSEREEWYTEGDDERIREAWKRKHDFLARMLKEGARAKIAYAGERAVGFIEYYPIEITNLELVGRDIMAIWCINVAEKERGKGIGRRLLRECLADAKQLGYKGVAVTCWDPQWMPSRLFKEEGFVEVGKAVGNGVVLLHPFGKLSEEYIPRWIGRGRYYEEAELVEGKAVLDIFHTDRCPIHWRNTALIKEIAAEFGDRVVIREYNVDDREDMLRHRIAYSVYLDGEVIAAGPQVEAEKIRNKIRSRLERFSSTIT